MIDLGSGVMILMIFLQGVELQLWFAVANLKASLAVKRRLVCEHVKYWEEVCVLYYSQII